MGEWALAVLSAGVAATTGLWSLRAVPPTGVFAMAVMTSLGLCFKAPATPLSEVRPGVSSLWWLVPGCCGGGMNAVWWSVGWASPINRVVELTLRLSGSDEHVAVGRLYVDCLRALDAGVCWSTVQFDLELGGGEAVRRVCQLDAVRRLALVSAGPWWKEVDEAANAS